MSSFSAFKTTFPIPSSYFGMVLGIAGMATAWRLAARVWEMPTFIGELLAGIAGLAWLFLSLAFFIKWVWFRQAALNEVNDAIQCCFISLFPGTTMLMGGMLSPYSRKAALILIIAGTVGQLAFAAYRSAGLWRGMHSSEATTPGIYLPTVSGNLISAITLGLMGYREWGLLFWGAGFFSWLSLEGVILHRLRTMGALPLPLRPSLGIQLAPPLVACEAYLFVTGQPDTFAYILFGYGLLQLIFLGRLVTWVLEQPFSVSFWAFSFGISALSVSSLHFVVQAPESLVAQMAFPIFIFANAMIALLLAGTLLRIIQGKFLMLPASPVPQELETPHRPS